MSVELSEDELASMREAVETISLPDRASVMTKAGTVIPPVLACRAKPSDLRPEEIGLGNRTTPVNLWDVYVPYGSEVLNTNPTVLSSYRIKVDLADGRVINPLHIVRYMGPKTEELLAHIVCEYRG